MKDEDEVWRAQYRANRYLKNESVAGLQRRANDIALNACEVDRFGKYGLARSGERWREVLTHIFEELGFRNIELPQPNLRRYMQTGRAAELWDKVNLPDGTYLIKFGRTKRMAEMLSKGVLRVSPAESYNDPSLNPAMAGREYEFIEETVGGSVQCPPNRDYSIPQWISAPIPGTLKRIRTYTGRSYIACFAMKYEYRAFEDFGYDACIVIRDPLRFLHAAEEAGQKCLPGWQFAFDPVTYRDPLRPTRNDDVLYSKHFRYSYQCEFRIRWEHAPGLESPLPPVFLQLGPLSEYCVLLAL